MKEKCNNYVIFTNAVKYICKEKGINYNDIDTSYFKNGSVHEYTANHKNDDSFGFGVDITNNNNQKTISVYINFGVDYMRVPEKFKDTIIVDEISYNDLRKLIDRAVYKYNLKYNASI